MTYPNGRVLNFGYGAAQGQADAADAYDGAKRRTVKESYTAGALTETRHQYYTEPAKWQVVEERTGGSSTADRQFVWGPRYIDDLIARDRDTTGTLDERLYALQDANWNVASLIDATGTIQERCAYTAYGTPTVLTPTFTPRTTSSYAWETLYAGYRFDAATGLFVVRNRVYAAVLGVWVQRDPLDYVDGINLYEYADARSISRTDPTGLQAGVNCQALFQTCQQDAQGRNTECKKRAFFVCIAACAAGVVIWVKGGGMVFKCVTGLGCESLCQPIYEVGCDLDLQSGFACCNQALNDCNATGKWPPWYWWIGC